MRDGLFSMDGSPVGQGIPYWLTSGAGNPLLAHQWGRGSYWLTGGAGVATGTELATGSPVGQG